LILDFGLAADFDIKKSRRRYCIALLNSSVEHRPIQNPRSKIQNGLSVRGLCKAFRTPSGRRVEVLRGVELTVEAGVMAGVMGASGAGKSTLLHLLGGLDRADAGEIRLGDSDIAGARGAELARLRNEQLGFVFQFHHLLPDLTAAENVSMPLLIKRTPRARALVCAAEMLERVGLAGRADAQVGLLSGGEQQRVAIARAVITRPRLILADEPTGNLDARASDEIGALLASFSREEGAAVVVATHNHGLARLCDRVLLLADGLLTEQPAKSN
jgi:lipoprotein-releasing system ATP-binding protein